ncbi:mas-related G-protein coupled receptor member H-like [Rhinatrema bivittatum]|uniref:mas-related G-protein coupled receptor member H-like n=1 Tax=Rhinatrema bivittatum TaxID=194408 RepID=UPI001128A9C5|nr:mas-related G-protein coupled receptor member H-like [Rhinatrema bivittatum]
MIRLSTADPSPVTEPGAGTVEDWRLLDSTYNFISWEEYISLVSSFLSFFGLVGNGIVLWFLGFKIKRNKFTVYILNLAMSDFLFLLGSSLLLILYSVSMWIYFLDVPHTIYKILNILYLFGYNTNQYLLTAISTERCFSILYPIWYHCQRPKHQSTILCAILWALASLVTAIEYFLCSDFFFSWNPTMETNHCLAVSIFLCILTFLVFTPIMVTSSLMLLIKVQKSSRRRQPSKLYVIIVVTVALFLTFSLPFRVLLFIEYYYQKYFQDIVICIFLLSIISSCINPVLYFYLGNRSRQRTTRSFKEALQQVFKDETIMS